MRVLVTGGAGFIGSHLVDNLVEMGYNVRVLDNFSSGRLENIIEHVKRGCAEVISGDLKDPELVIKAVENAEVVFHFAANPEVRVSTTNPEIHFNENIVTTFNLLEAMRKSNVKEIVFASSSSVYGDPAELPVGESAPIRPASVYGASKAACENLIHAYSHLYGLRAVVLRYANVVGPRLRHGVVYDFIIKLLKDPNLLEILGDGGQVRSYVHVTDAVEATMIAWKRSASAFVVYNIGSGDWVSVNDVADVIAEVMGLKGIRRVYRPILHGVGWLGDVKCIALSIDKIKALGWKPRMGSREALRETARSILSEIRGSAGEGVKP
ncbi:MAG: SDR family NAD(P)-dependent oxidoreductase [Candidatus Bathyarchaeia archaeon]